MRAKVHLYNEYPLKMIFLFLNILYCIPIFMVQVDNFMNLIVLLIGIYIYIDIFKGQNIFYTKSALLSCFFVLFFLCTILRNRFDLTNVKLLVYIFIQMLFLTHFNKKKNINLLFHEIHIFKNFIVYITFIINIISLVLYFIGYCEVYTNDVTSMELLVGRHPNSSLYGILANSNWMSFLEITNIGLLLLSINYSSLKRKLGCFFHIIISIVVLFLTNSRGGLVGLITLVFFYLIGMFLHSIKSNPKAAGKYLLLIPLCFVLVLTGNILTKKVASFIYTQIKVPNYTESSVSIEYEPQVSNEPAPAVARAENEMQTSTNIRILLWTTGFQAFKESPILGFGTADIGNIIQKHLPEGSIINDLALASNTHNIYIQTALTSGFIGITLFLGYIIRNLSYCLLKIYKNNISYGEKKGLIVGCSLIITYLVINLVEADIFMSRNFMSTLFWIILGYVTRIAQLSGYMNKE